MVHLIQANQLELYEVEEKLNLRQVKDEDFFLEWQGLTPDLSESERQWLDQVKADFLYLLKYPLHEEVVKLVVLSPLLSLAGLYRHPFQIRAEQAVELAIENEQEDIIRGRIDVLVLHQRLWVTVVEAKRKQFNVLEAVPQALIYMMDSPNTDQSVFGFLTNGSEFLFLKLIKQESCRYAIAPRLFSMVNAGNDLYQVLAILRQLGEVVKL